MKKIHRRDFLEYSAVTTAAIAAGLVFSGPAKAASVALDLNAAALDPNAAALAALRKSPYASSAMPSMFSAVVDATGFEQY